MKINLRTIFVLVFVITIACAPKEEQPDLVLINSNIWTGNTIAPWAEWIAIKDDKIVELGEGLPPQGIEQIDMKGNGRK